eukprot:CAMPEP_0117070466 /NCGR_PEP_ID=MMETSP0472-20121206/49507_1 /TAXON_ID=693140 ORGANISM="Tiarina fusus, Strain LIS" /NCGR_SAMPLE_ID=MMETSP0472 /ASSEMBLY_ACC=CAM_ASM_000603 /LENGTH=103 /DNA_ID=CAMNT_0004793585 /DNA_START=473 /DNA_END=784 /DNA_ORIENTATION=-
MAWMEVSFETSKEHEALVDRIQDVFVDQVEPTSRVPWAPHASLAYTNPDALIPLEVLEDLLERFPTLTRSRRVAGVSLWSTQGTIDQWKRLHRIRFDGSKQSE